MAFGIPFSLPRICLMTILILTCIFSIAILALTSSSLKFISEYYQTGSFTLVVNRESKGHRDRQDLGFLPLTLFRIPTKLSIAAAVLSLITSLASLGLVTFFWPDGKRTYKIAPRKILPLVLGLNALLVLVAFICLFATHTQTSNFDPSYTDSSRHFGSGGVYTGGRFDLETWVCDLATYLRRANPQHDLFRLQCGNETASRWVLLPLLLLAFGSAGVAFWALGREEGLVSMAEERLHKRRAFWHSDGWEEMGGSRTHGLEGLPRERFVGAG